MKWRSFLLLAAVTMAVAQSLAQDLNLDRKASPIQAQGGRGDQTTSAATLISGLAGSDRIFEDGFEAPDEEAAEFLVNSIRVTYQAAPSAATLVNGGFVVAWHDHSGTLGDVDSLSIKARRFDEMGVPQGDEFLVNTNTDDTQQRPAVSGLADGGFVVAWTDFSGTLGDDDESSIKARRYDATGQPRGEFLVNTNATGGQRHAAVATLSNGDFIVIWADGGGIPGGGSGRGTINAQRYDAFGHPQGEEFLVSMSTANSHSAPAISALTVVAGETGSWQWAPSVAGLADGDFLVTWYFPVITISLNAGRGDDVLGRRYNAVGEPRTEAFKINASSIGRQNHPSLISRPDGGFVVAWEDSSDFQGDTDNIKAKRYDANGDPVPTPFDFDPFPGDISSTLLTLGVSSVGVLDSVNDKDWFHISLMADNEYTLTLRGASSGGGTLLDPLLKLYDAEGKIIDSNDNDGTGFDSRLVFTPNESETYYLLVQDWVGPGSYTLKVD